MRLGVPTLCCYEALDRLIASAERGSEKPDGYVIIDNGGGYEPKAQNVELIRPGRNLGVAASWNMLLRSGETMVISNDDIEFEQDTFARFVEAIAKSCLALSPAGWDLFAQTSEAVARIGWYDEQFWPAYYEDLDYARRASLAGIEPIVVDAPYKHDRSLTLRTSSEAWVIRRGSVRSHEHFIRKWGGSPGEETYTVPFGGLPCKPTGLR